MHVIYNTVIADNGETIAEVDHRDLTGNNLYVIKSDLLFNFSFDICTYREEESVHVSVELHIHNDRHGKPLLHKLLKKYYKKLLEVKIEDEHDIDAFIIELLPLFELIEKLSTIIIDNNIELFTS